jgi:hypothetical protein
MPMNNPEGVNGFQGFAPEPAYGMKTAEARLEQAAPLPANPAINAPRRGQKQVVKGRKPAAPAQQAAQPAAQPVVAVPPLDPTQVPSPQAQVAALWAQIAATPGASPLVQQIAAQAQHGSV